MDSTPNIKSQKKVSRIKIKTRLGIIIILNVVKKKDKQSYQSKKREFKICRYRMLFDEKIKYLKKYETCLKKVKKKKKCTVM